MREWTLNSWPQLTYFLCSVHLPSELFLWILLNDLDFPTYICECVSLLHQITQLQSHLWNTQNKSKTIIQPCMFGGKIAHYWRNSWTSMLLINVHLDRQWNLLCITIQTVSGTWTNPFSLFIQTLYWQNYQ